MSTRTNVIERNGHTKTKTAKSATLWSRAITKSEWTDKVSAFGPLTIDINSDRFRRFAGRISGRHLLGTTSAGHYNWRRLGCHSTEWIHCDCIVNFNIDSPHGWRQWTNHN